MGTRKCECPFKIRCYMLASTKWRCSVVCGLHNHDLCAELQGHPVACQLNPVEKASIKDMFLNFVQPKNVFATLKRTESDNISNIRKMYNQRYHNKKESRGDRSEMQHLLKMLDDNKYVVRYKYCDDEKICEKYPDLLKYVESTILDKVKEKFVCAWTDKVRYLGNTTTNRVESAHATLKNWSCDRKGDLCKAWDTINHMILNQHNEIQTLFGRSIMVLEHRFKNNILYSKLIGNVSRAGLNYIFHEANRGEIIGGDTAKCGCTITITYGLPCACAIAKKVRLGEPITMNKITPHWKRLSFDDNGCVEEDSNISIISELEVIQERFSKVDDYTKLYIKEQLRRIGFSETTDMKPSSQPVKTKGAPKKVRSTPNDNSTTRSPSYCEHVDKLFPDSLTPKSQKS
ncbi:uncharacterized protein LOC131626410 [Vicia villosa]|uniref:uncharacterized protein LOC131626410 n=1 Tax=Vicia villosa TaxID=3911 RepID=UPI00273C25A9|nr:uncharacterized protein LOC131626410 [Vicia villosa]